jgi:hypothetical protein
MTATSATERAPEVERTPAVDGTTDDAPGGLTRDVRILLHASAAAVWLGLLLMYERVWLRPRDVSGDLETWAQAVVDGTSAAPYQFRLLVPHLVVGLHDALGWSVGQATIAVDVVAMAVAVAATAVLLRRLALEAWVLPIALYGATLGIGLLWWGKFETVTAFAGVAIALVGIVSDEARTRWACLLPAAVILTGTRTDLLIAVGVALLARWRWAGRRPADLAAGLLLGAAGAVATLALKAAYPDAAYPDGVSLVQVAHNLQPLVLLTLVAFLLPALGPWLLADRQPALRAALDADREALVPLLALVLAEVAATLVVGRVEEVRLLFPLATALGLLGVVGWRALLQPRAA